MKRTWRALAALILACALAGGAAPPVGAVVQARSTRDTPPRVTLQVQGEPPRPLGTVGLMPLGDSPRAPGTGQAVEDAVCSILASRGSECQPLDPPRDAAGQPVPGGMVGEAQLLAAGRAAGVAAALTGRVTQLDVEASWQPSLTVWRPGVLVDVPAGAVIRTNLAFQLRAVAVESGKPLCTVQVHHGPVERPPRQALAEAATAALDQCFGSAQ